MEKERKSEQGVQERVRPAASGGTSAAYFVYQNKFDKPDTLISVSSEVSSLTQIHESYKSEDGMMGMREQKEVVISSGEKLIFKQGGLHIMLIDLQEDLNSGDSVAVELEWKVAGRVSKKLLVQQ